MAAIAGIDKGKYIGFRLTNVVASLYNARNKALVDPFSFFFGRFRVSRQAVLKRNFEEWRRFEAKEKTFEPVFDPGRVVNAYTGEKKPDDTPITERMRLSDLSLELLVENIGQWVQHKYGNKNLMREGSNKVFSDTNVRAPYEGEIWLNGHVRIKGKAAGRGKFHRVSIAGPLEASAVKLANLYCDCDEFQNVLRKHGYTNGQYLCPDIAALLYYSRYTPNGVSNLEAVMARRNARIWLPFHPFELQPATADYRVIKKGQQPKLSNLMVTAMLFYLTQKQGENKSSINKGLKRLEVIYDPMLKRLFGQGKADAAQEAGYEAIAQKWIWDLGNEIWSPLRAWKNEMHNYLTTRAGFEFKGLVVEKERALYETVAMEYVKKSDLGHSVRLLFFDGLPPLVIERRVVPEHKVDIFALEKKSYRKPKPMHFYEELYAPKTTYDYRRCRFTFSEVRFAHEIWNPQEMMPDYYKALQHFYGSKAIGRLAVQINRVRPPQLERLDVPKEFYSADKERYLTLVNTIGKQGRQSK